MSDVKKQTKKKHLPVTLLYYYCCIWYDTSVEKTKNVQTVLNIHKLNSNYKKNI